MSQSEAAKRRRAAAIGASILAHLVVFVIIARNVPKLVFQEPQLQAANIWLMPRLNRQTHETKPRPSASATTALPSAAPSTPKPVTAPSTAQIAPAQPSADASAGAAPGAAQTGAGVQGALRTSIGCDIGRSAHLTPEEKDRCNQRMGEEAHKGPKFIDMIPPEKRAYYDAVQQAYQAASDPMHPFVRDKYGNVQPWGKGPGVACGMKFGGPPQPPDHRSLTDKIKATGLLGVDLGPLKCGIVIPQGSMTPEIGIPTP